MHILVKGTEVVAWDPESPPAPRDASEVPFDVDDGGFLASLEPGKAPHWDGLSWWAEEERLTAEDLAAALAELAALIGG